MRRGTGEYAWIDALLFRDAVNAIVKADGNNGLTRKTMLEQLTNTHSFDADGMWGTTDVGARKAGPCFFMMQVQDGKFKRVYPKKPATRRVFSADYKLAILAEYDACSESGEKGAILRREGLYSSLITDWRRQHRQGLLKANLGRSDGGRGGPSLSELAKLRAENERLRTKLAQAEVIIDVQGKVHALLEEISKSAASDDTSTR